MGRAARAAARREVTAAIRVLTVGNRPPDPSAGGYEVVWADLVAALRERGHDVDVLHPPALPSWWQDGRWRDAGRWRAGREDRGARRVLREALDGIDAVVWLNLGGLAMGLLDEAAGVPQVGLVHDGWMLYGPLRDPGHRGPLRPPDALWCFNSAYTRERTQREVPLARTEVVTPGVDPGLFPAAASRPWEGRLLVVGRISPEKGVDVAVGALGELPDCTLEIVGPGEPPRHDRVRAAGAVPRDVLHERYAAADAVLFPVTWPEPWGLVPLEAMSVGRPVVATGTGGSGEYLRDGDNCLLVAPGDASALAAAVRRLAADADLRGRLVHGGRATAARHGQAAFLDRTVALIEAEAGA